MSDMNLYVAVVGPSPENLEFQMRIMDKSWEWCFPQFIHYAFDKSSFCQKPYHRDFRANDGSAVNGLSIHSVASRRRSYGNCLQSENRQIFSTW
jgi:hypothetical protein